MTGARVLVQTLVDAGVEVCFSNPGTSEMHFLAALDDVAGIRCVLGLFEGVATGAADGYARMAGKPAATLLHLGPGLANGLANLHNARRGGVPVVNVIGDHAGYHRHHDAPLTSDVRAVAAPMSHWVRASGSSDVVARDGAEAVAAALHPPGRVATLILPADASWNPTDSGAAALPPVPAPHRVADSAVEAAAGALSGGEPAMLLLGGSVSRARLATAGAIAARTGARLAAETFCTRLAHGAGTAALERIPYFPERAAEALRGVRRVVLVGSRPPVSFFAYPGLASELAPPECRFTTLATAAHDIDDALARLGEAVGATGHSPALNPLRQPGRPAGELTPAAVGQSVAALMPRDAIVIDEGICGAAAVFPMTATAEPHDWLIPTGGSIGWGLPAAVGAAIACPNRKVLCLEGDGSAMYTIQALWTMAREKLDVVTIIFANRSYQILNIEYQRVGAARMGATARSQMSLADPEIDFAALAESMGVPATRATGAEEFHDQLAAALDAGGPRLIEAVMPTGDPRAGVSTL